MASYPKIKIKHSPITTYPGTAQDSYVGAQSVAGRRGSLPTFTDGNSYFISKAGDDANAGTAAAPKLTLASLFNTSYSTNDTSGNAYHLTATGTVLHISYPCAPIPPQGNHAVGPFNVSRYLSAPAGLLTALSGLTDFTIEGYFHARSIGAINSLWSFNDTTVNHGYVNTDGTINFIVDGVTLTSATSLVAAGNWYYFKFYFDSAAASGKRIYLGTSPEDAVLVASATQTRTLGTVSAMNIGVSITPSTPLVGFMDRLVIKSNADETLPVAPSASNILAFYEFETRPLMQTAPKSYIVFQDSGTYYEGLYANFRYDITAGFGIYAADGYTPKFKVHRGVFPGTYGAGNSGYVPPTSSASTTCYVSKAGNDGTGARGNSSLPFLTIQAALTATTTTGDTVQVQDSAVYTEGLTLPNRSLTIQAASGQVPVLKPSASTQLFTLASASNTYTLAGLLFAGNNTTTNTLLDNGTNAVTVSFLDCTVDNFEALVDRAATVTLTDSYFSRVAKTFDSGDSANIASATNCFFLAYDDFGHILSVRHCTFDMTGATTSTTFLTMNILRYGASLTECEFLNGLASIRNSSTGGVGANFKDFFLGFKAIDLENATLKMPGQTTGVAGGTTGVLFEGIVAKAGAGTFAAGLHIEGDASGNLIYPLVKNCASIDYTRGVYIVASTGVTNAVLENISTLNCTTAGVDSPAILFARGLADDGSGVAYQSGIAPTLSISSAAYISTADGTENLCLSASSPGAYIILVGSLQADAGVQAALFAASVSGLVVDGLTFEGSANREGGIASDSDQAVTVRYSTFSGLGPFGIRAPSLSAISKNLFATNGHAVKAGGYATTITNNVAYGCGGAANQNFSRAATITENSSYACEYGQYDSRNASLSLCRNNVYAASGAFDYSGDDELTYSCVGTLDPDRPNTLDANSIREDPLFADPDNGDLTLQALARDYYFNSPCIGISSGAADMGAFEFTYGAASTTWTTIDFATSTYVNPDQVARSQDAIKLAEGDREDGAIYSTAPTIKKGYVLTWDTSSSPMPLAQLAELISMYLSSSNQIQVNLGLGAGYEDGYFGRSSGFEYSDLGGLYADDAMPQPLRQLSIRMA